MQKNLNEGIDSEAVRRGAILKRVRQVLQREAEMIGFGEMSKFGHQNVQKIYDNFAKERNDLTALNEKRKAEEKSKRGALTSASEPIGGMRLWEINAYLDKLGSETFFDNDEYKRMMDQHGFLYDRVRDRFDRV